MSVAFEMPLHTRLLNQGDELGTNYRGLVLTFWSGSKFLVLCVTQGTFVGCEHCVELTFIIHVFAKCIFQREDSILNTDSVLWFDQFSSRDLWQGVRRLLGKPPVPHACRTSGQPTDVTGS